MRRWLRRQFGLLNPLYVCGLSRMERKLPVLCYHRLLPDMPGQTKSCMHIPPTLFETHVDRLSRLGFRFIGLEEFELMIRGQIRHDKRAILLTFDDGYKDLLLVYERLAKKYAFRATVFVIGSAVGKPGPLLLKSLDQPASEHLARHEDLWTALDWHDLRALQGLGADVGMHGHVHSPVSAIDPQEFRRQILKDSEAMKAALGFRPWAFALPYGQGESYTRQHLQELVARGFRLVFSTHSSRIRVPATHLPLPRLVVQPDEAPSVMCRNVFGASDIIGEFRRRRSPELSLQTWSPGKRPVERRVPRGTDR
ncbi:polysaccharide deacetylase [Desulfocurvibacter africanus subsp. africanus str. Walvis Bay]|uniref:Polysaccharide deacetylase n=2 Tax=Desulfocurvibacter africanus TaxID=873 RepID=F3YXQ1_DESAF|nr:polysaccharide deacetylase [Desulfocurvibacter africanus subsp. africanus str. Walvis Bay]